MDQQGGQIYAWLDIMVDIPFVHALAAIALVLRSLRGDETMGVFLPRLLGWRGNMETFNFNRLLLLSTP